MTVTSDPFRGVYWIVLGVFLFGFVLGLSASNGHGPKPSNPAAATDRLACTQPGSSPLILTVRDLHYADGRWIWTDDAGSQASTNLTCLAGKAAP